MDNKLNDLKAALNAGIVKLVFEKKDGTKWTAMATTRPDFIPQPQTKKFLVTGIKWDTVVDGEQLDVDLPKTADVIVNSADIAGAESKDEVDYVIVDILTEKFGFLVECCNVQEVTKQPRAKNDNVVTFVDTEKKAWRSCNFSQVISWENA